MLFAEFKERIERKYKEVFPNSRCCCRVVNCLGKSIDIHCVFTKDNKECANGIIDNDMFMVRFNVSPPVGFFSKGFNEETDEMPNELVMTSMHTQFRTKPESDYYWCNYKKVPYRKTRGNAAKMCETFGRFVDRLHDSVCEEINNNNIHQNDLPLIAEKIV